MDSSSPEESVGRPCTLSAGPAGSAPLTGVCRLISSCPWAVRQLRSNAGRPKICSFVGPNPVVCCPGEAIGDRNRNPSPPESAAPPPPAQEQGAIAKEKCWQYAQYVYAEMDSLTLMASTVKVDQCSASADPLIVGGSLAKPMEFPHMALVGFDNSNGSVDYNCGGSLISPQFVLTAAHCMLAPGGQPARWVLLGELDRSTDTDDAEPQTIEVGQRIPHPDYKPPVKYHDIALLRLASPARMTGHVRPACLHVGPELALRADLRDSLVATGWGHTEFVGDPSDQLRKVALFPSTLEKCRKAFDNVPRFLPRNVVSEVQLCAGGGGKDTCQGDSGGPLQLFTRNASGEEPQPYCMHMVVGVTSFGRACGFSAPAIYTRVSAYVPWIEREVWPRGQEEHADHAPDIILSA